VLAGAASSVVRKFRANRVSALAAETLLRNTNAGVVLHGGRPRMAVDRRKEKVSWPGRRLSRENPYFVETTGAFAAGAPFATRTRANGGIEDDLQASWFRAAH
jgi:hypothetical protein